MMSGAFEAFKAHGYTHLIPVIPGDAKPSPRSHLGLNGAWEKNRGKMPGTLWADGGWGGLQGWQKIEATDADLAAWQTMGANVGLQLDEGLLTVDIDVDDAEIADDVERIAIEALGPSPCRVGRWPHRMLFYRLAERVYYKSWRIGAGALIECQSKGHQVVLYGTHPSGKKYEWLRKPVERDALALVTPASWSAWVSALGRSYPLTEAEGKERHVDRATIDQASLRGELADVRRAVEALPNTYEVYPDRAHYIRMLYAIKAALPDDGAEAYEIWTGWAERYARAKPEDWEKDWRNSRPPFEIGASWLYDEAAKRSEGAFTRADASGAKANIAFEDLGPAPQSEPGVAVGAPGERELKLWSISELDALPDPRWLIARHLPDVSMGFLYGKPSAGKSFLALDMALSIAAGFPTWHGDKIDSERRRVVYIAAEGKRGMRNRIAAWRSRQGLDAAGAALLEANFALIAETINFMKAEDVGLLLRKVREAGERPSLLVVDTVSRMLPGADENLQKDMTVFVSACDAAKDAFECAVIGIHHSSKDGGAMRGSSVLLGAGDFVFLLERKEGPFGDLFCEKQKDGPDRWHDAYAFSAVSTARGESLVVARAKTKADGSISVDGMDNEILTSMRAAWDEGSPWTPAPQGRDRHAIKRMCLDFGLSRGEAEKKLRSWLAQHIIAVEIQSSKMRIRGYKVTDGYGQAVQISNIFG